MVTIIFLCLLFSPFVVRSKCKNKRSRKARYTWADVFADASKAKQARSVSSGNRRNLTSGKIEKSTSASDLEKEEKKHQAELKKQIKQRQAEHAKAQRELEKEERAREKAEIAEKKHQAAAEKLATEKQIASSQLQYIDHRIKQLESLRAFYEDKQEGTLANGHEYFKYERNIMKCEKDLQVLAQQQIKFRSILRKTI